MNSGLEKSSPDYIQIERRDRSNIFTGSYEINKKLPSWERSSANSLVNKNSAVIIPALNPSPDLVMFVQELLKQGIPQVIVVNDGSSNSYDGVFREIEKLERCTLLTHEVNRGKGRALKTAFSYFAEHYPLLDGVVTADSDGQHAVDDICKICERQSLKEHSLILGVRNFRENNIPKRSYIGNRMTSRIFQLLYGTYLEDTQTGLRGIPASEIKWMSEMNGERYDFEINMLIKTRKRNIDFSTVDIKTLYFDNNSGSHYNPIKDSARIFLCLISGLVQYAMSLIVSGLFDVTCFFLLNSIAFTALPAPVRLFASTAIARVVSSMCNYSMNRKLIFGDKGKLTSSAARYYTLWLFLMIASYGLVYAASLYWRVNESIIKLVIDLLLGIASYQIQLHWVFSRRD